MVCFPDFTCRFLLEFEQFESKKQVKALILQLHHTVTQHLRVVVISEINIETGVVDPVHHHGTGIFDVLGAGMVITAKTVLSYGYFFNVH